MTFNIVTHATNLLHELQDAFAVDNDGGDPTKEQLLAQIEALEATDIDEIDKLHDAAAIGYLIATFHSEA